MTPETHDAQRQELSVTNEPNVKDVRRLWHAFVDMLAGGRAAIVYHGDLDGAIGAAYIRRALAQRGLHVQTYWVSTEEYHFRYLRDWLRRLRPAACVFSDVSIENSPRALEEIVADVAGPILVYDHHYVTNDSPLPQNVVLANPTPKLKRGDRHIPTFVLAHMIANDLNIQFPDWLLVLAIFAEGVDEFYTEELARLGTNAFGPQPAFDRRFYQRSGLQRASTLIRAEYSSEKKTENVLALIDDVIDGRIASFLEFKKQLEERLSSVADDIGHETSMIIDAWKLKIAAEYGPEGVVFIPIDSRYSIAGPVASVLRGTYRDKVIVTSQMRGDFAVIEVRTRNDTLLNLPEILKQVASRVPVINSGGHPSAAGALIEAAGLKDFSAALQQAVSSACR